MLIGLTGGYCAGKNSVAAILAREGWACIDVDALGHEAIDMAADAILERFGAAVLNREGRVDRRALARIVFSDASALADQEAIVHPVAIRLMLERIAAATEAARASGAEPRVCVNAALLHRADIIPSCDAVIEVRAPLLLRIARGMRRDGAGALPAVRRITRQRGFRAALRAAARKAGRPIFALRNGRGRGSLEAEIARVLGLVVSIHSNTWPRPTPA
jgi:dephospho-CoA kinase